MKNHIREFWTSDRSLSVLLWVLGIAAFAVIPLAALGDSHEWERTAISTFFVLLVLSGVLATWADPRMRRVMLAAALAPVVLLLLEAFYRTPVFTLVSGGVRLSLVAVFAAVLLGRVLARGPVTGERIKGALAVYLLIALIFEECYRLMSIVAPHSLSVQSSNPLSVKYTAELLYFSFSTMTTAGYGDIVPINPLARSLANLEAITGQMYIVLLIGSLLSQRMAEAGKANS